MLGPTAGTKSSSTSSPTLRRVPGMVTMPSSRCSIASIRWRTAAASVPIGSRCVNPAFNLVARAIP
jgi:hypothetical protein